MTRQLTLNQLMNCHVTTCQHVEQQRYLNVCQRNDIVDSSHVRTYQQVYMDNDHTHHFQTAYLTQHHTGDS